MSNKTIIPATGDWYFIHKVTNSDQPNIFPIAAWQANLETNEDVIGLVGITSAKNENNKSTLVAPPSVEGSYIKRHVGNKDLLDDVLKGKSKVSYAELLNAS